MNHFETISDLFFFNLGDEVMPPLVARMLCWVTNVWPHTVQEKWDGGEPPQVQKYCITSMQGSYTGMPILVYIKFLFINDFFFQKIMMLVRSSNFGGKYLLVNFEF